MKLVINGEERTLPDVATLAALIESLDMKPDRIAVELNRESCSEGSGPRLRCAMATSWR